MNQLLANQGINWLSEPLQKHFINKANQYLDLKQKEIQSKNRGSNLNRLDMMNITVFSNHHKRCIVFESPLNLKGITKVN